MHDDLARNRHDPQSGIDESIFLPMVAELEARRIAPENWRLQNQGVRGGGRIPTQKV
jgi:hypothetical protein